MLVAEDNTMNMTLVRGVLRNMRQKVRILEASDGGEAIAVYQRERPDIILMDVQMPGTDGIAATRTIRSMEAGEKTPYADYCPYGRCAYRRPRYLSAGWHGCFPEQTAGFQKNCNTRWIPTPGTYELLISDICCRVMPVNTGHYVHSDGDQTVGEKACSLVDGGIILTIL